MDKTNRSLKLCRRIAEIEYILSINEGRAQTELDNYRDELDSLELELKSIIVA